MRLTLLKKIYYVTNDSFLSIPEKFSQDFQKHGINFYQVPYVSIEKFLPPKNLPLRCCLILCDIPELALAFQENGYFTVAVLNEKNKDLSFESIPFVISDITDIDWHYYIRLWQRFMGIPWHIMDTDRCKVREITPEDIDNLYQMYSDKRIVRFTDDLYQERQAELQYTKDYIEKIYRYYGFGTWLIEDIFTGELIGRAGFNYRPEFEDPELGFVIDPKYWRKGFAYEVCSALMIYAKDQLYFEKVQALVMPENTASIELLKKLGFIFDNTYNVNDIEYHRYVIEL